MWGIALFIIVIISLAIVTYLGPKISNVSSGSQESEALVLIVKTLNKVIIISAVGICAIALHEQGVSQDFLGAVAEFIKSFEWAT